jgi:hypothetical protein
MPKRSFGRGRVDETDQPTSSRLGRIKGQRLAHKQRELIAALAQTIKQRHVGHVDKPDGARPRGRASETSFAETVSQNHAQNVDGVFDCTSAQESFRVARARLEARRSAEPTDELLPVSIDFVGHPTLESQSDSSGQPLF